MRWLYFYMILDFRLPSHLRVLVVAVGTGKVAGVSLPASCKSWSKGKVTSPPNAGLRLHPLTTLVLMNHTLNHIYFRYDLY